MSYRYQFWDKKSTLYPPVNGPLEPESIFQQYGWTRNPNAKVVISKGPEITAGVIMSFNMMVQQYVDAGMEIPEGADDQTILDCIEAWEDLNNVDLRDPEDADPQVKLANAMDRLATIEEYNAIMAD